MPIAIRGRRANNFDALRLLAALSVVFSHSFLIAEGSEANEPFVWLTGNQCILGLVGVFVFFVISGYLVTESWCRSPAPGWFALRRGLRIYPGLIINVALCAFVRYEVMMYLMIVILGMLRILRLSTCLVLTALGIAAVYFEQALTPFGDFGEWAWFLGFFGAGMVLHFLRDRLSWDWRWALLAVLALVVFVRLGHFIMLFPLAGAYLAIWFARRYDPWLDYSRYSGDLSYGLYIYGWPAEQLVMWLSGGRAVWWQVFFGSLALALPMAWLSWHGIENWASRWARRAAARPLAVAAAPIDG